MVQMNETMVDVCAPTDESLLAQLATALERAVKAEKAFLRLKKETFDAKIKNDIRIAEKEYLDKTKLYSGIPDQMRRIRSEFEKESAELIAQRGSAEKVYNYCIEGLDLGLTMDQLPLTTENADDVKQMIQSKLQAKKMPSMAANVTNGGTQNITKDTVALFELAPPDQHPGAIRMSSPTSSDDQPYYSVSRQQDLCQYQLQEQQQQPVYNLDENSQTFYGQFSQYGEDVNGPESQYAVYSALPQVPTRCPSPGPSTSYISFNEEHEFVSGEEMSVTIKERVALDNTDAVAAVLDHGDYIAPLKTDMDGSGEENLEIACPWDGCLLYHSTEDLEKPFEGPPKKRHRLEGDEGDEEYLLEDIDMRAVISHLVNGGTNCDFTS